MAFSWFLKLAFKCLHHFAWPLLALCYPLYASVQAIETDSYKETRELISYWILLSLIYLFDYTFMSLLQRFLFWPYIKLMIIFWLIIPDFRRASYVYNNLIGFIKPRIVTFRLSNYWRKCFVEKDNFLLHAERYMKENGTEALEKLIASKNPMYGPDAEATIAVRATDTKDTKLRNGKILQTEQNGIEDLEVIEKKEIPANKQDIPVMPNLVPSQSASSVTVETNGSGKLPQSAASTHKEVQKERTCAPQSSASTHKEVQKERTCAPQSSASTHKEVQKEWTCALCQVTTSSEQTLNSHLKGRKHKNTCEALKAKKQPTQEKVNISGWKEELKQKNIINQQNSNAKNANKGLKGTIVMDHKVQKQQKNLSEPKSSIFKCVVCDVILQSEANVASHFGGKKHLANIQSKSGVLNQASLPIQSTIP